MSLFNRGNKQPKPEPTVEDILSRPEYHDFTFLEDLLPYEAIQCLGLDPNSDPNTLVPELLKRSEANPQFGLFDITQSLGEYLIYQSPQKRHAVRLLQNPKDSDDKDWECMRAGKAFNMIGEPVDERAWSRGWMTQDEYWGELLSDCYSESFPVYKTLDGPDIPDEWLNFKEKYAKENDPLYADKLAERHTRQAVRSGFGQNGQPSVGSAQDKESERFGPER